MKNKKRFKFTELSQEVQHKVLENFYMINVEDEWWRDIFDSAEEIGLSVGDEFNLDHNYVEVEFNLLPAEVSNLIVTDHPAESFLYKAAKEYLLSPDHSVLLESCKKWLLNCLSQHYEELTSHEWVKDTLIATKAEFTEDGKKYNKNGEPI